MKHLLITLAIIFSSASLLEAQWTVKNINTTFNAVSRINEKVAYAVTGDGLMCKTIDGGESWKFSITGNSNNYQAIYFKDENNGWALAYAYSNNLYIGTSIMKTTDGGNTWVEKSRCPDQLHSFLFVNDTLAVIVGDNGTILRTGDGGENWKRITNTQVIHLYSVNFINEKIGCVVGKSGLIMRTSDGGLNWTVVRKDFDTKSPNTYTSVCFSDINTAWTVGYTYDAYHGYYHNRLLKSTDGGNTWDYPAIPGFYGSKSQSIYFSDSQNGWIASDASIYWTSDGGNNWQKAAMNSQAPTVVSAGAINSAVVKSNNGIGVSQTDILMSNDGGKSWESSFSCQYYKITSMGWINPNRGWANGNGFILTTDLGWVSESDFILTTDGGKHWNKQPSAKGYDNIYFADSLTGFGSKNTGIYKTIDGGNTWELVHSPSGQEGTITMHFINKNTGWATDRFAFTKNHMVKTTDGGKTWTSTPLYDGIYFNKYFFLDENNGYVISNDWIIKKTTDGGNSWTELCWSKYIRDIFFLDVNTGWAAGDKGMVWAYDGHTWTQYNTGVDVDLHSVYFTDKNNGWAVGDKSTIVHTADGGKTWTQQRYIPAFTTGHDLYSITFPTKDKGFISGDGLMLECSNPTITDTTEHTADTTGHPVDNYNLSQNYPNPFNPSTTISYSIPKQSHVELKVYDMLGREVITLVNEYKPVGNYTVKFNAASLPSGVYIYSIQAGQFRDEKKLVLLR